MFKGVFLTLSLAKTIAKLVRMPMEPIVLRGRRSGNHVMWRGWVLRGRSKCSHHSVCLCLGSASSRIEPTGEMAIQGQKEGSKCNLTMWKSLSSGPE